MSPRTICFVTYQLIDRKLVDDKSEENEGNQVMLKDGLRDADDLKKEDQDNHLEDEKKDDDLEDEKKDAIGAKYMKVINTVSFRIYLFILLSFQSRNMEDPRLNLQKSWM